MEKTLLKIGGMNCNHCVASVTQTLKSLPGVSDVVVNLKAGTASFSHQPELCPLSDVKAAIENQGFTAEQ